MALDPIVVKFFNETLRPQADQLSGIVHRPTDFLAQFEAKGIGPLLGLDPELLTRDTPLAPEDYAGVSGDPLDDGRAGEGVTQLTAREVLAFYRILKFLASALESDPDVAVLAMRIAINPRG